MRPPFFIVVGRSGSGKTTLIDRITGRLRLVRTVTCTTRPRRYGEPMNAYSFVHSLDNLTLLERASYGGYEYGTPTYEVEASDVVAATPDGAEAIKQFCLDKGRPCYIIGLDCDTSTVMSRLGDVDSDRLNRVLADERIFSGLSAQADLFIPDFNIEEDWDTVVQFICNRTIMELRDVR